MPVRPHVPRDLESVPFLAGEAVTAGRLTRDQVRSACWRRLLRGVYVHASIPVTPELRLAAVRLVSQPDVVAQGLLAAWLHGLWTPAEGRVVPLDITQPLRTAGAGRHGLGGRRLTLRGTSDWRGATVGHSSLDRYVVEVGGLLVTSPLRTCFDLLRTRRLVEAVVVADAFLFADAFPHALLATYTADRRRWPSVREARIAVDLSSSASRSPGESRLRMVVVLAGLPVPWVNVPILDAWTDRVLGVPDLRIDGRRPAGLEYDGAYHDEDEQQRADRRRSNRLATCGGLPLLRYDRVSVRDERRTILDDIRAVTGLKPTTELDDADFWRPPASRAW